jgi:agmatinase
VPEAWNANTVMSSPPVLLGVPFDAASSYRRGAALAPPRIREALRSPAGNNWAERIVEVVCDDGFEDLGDLDLRGADAARTQIEAAIAALAGRSFIALGGDHSITYPIVRGLGVDRSSLTILHVDAHPDLYDEFGGDRFSHACPFARIMEEGLARRLIQVGIRTMTGHQRDQARRFGVEQIDMRAWAAGARPHGMTGPVYVSIDLDGIDPAFAPGVSHREPGGLSVRDVLGLLASLDASLVGADIVEFNPAVDVSDLTALVAAKLVKEVLAVWRTAS